MMNSEFLDAFVKNLLNADKSIRWIGITDKNGVFINERYQDGIRPLLSREENQESAVSAINRHRTRLKFEAKIGKLTYAFGKYENLCRSIIPLSENYYLLVTIDFKESNYDKIIMEKIIPIVQRDIERFIV